MGTAWARHVMCELALYAFIAVCCIKAGNMSRTKHVQCIEDGNEGLLLVPINEDTLCLFTPLPPSVISLPNAVRI